MGRDYSFRSPLSKEDIDELISSNRAKKQQINNSFLAMAVLLLAIILLRILKLYLGYQIITYLALLLFIVGFYLIIKTFFLVKKVDDDETTLTNLLAREERLQMVVELREPRKKVFSMILVISLGLSLTTVFLVLIKMVNFTELGY